MLEARELADKVPRLVAKMKKLGLGTPSRVLKKDELALIAPPAPVAVPAAKAAKGAKSILKIDGEEVEVEEIGRAHV